MEANSLKFGQKVNLVIYIRVVFTEELQFPENYDMFCPRVFPDKSFPMDYQPQG